MRNSDVDIREQMNDLDTLSSGIVYDKDGAWKKLQLRMDKKPANTLRFYYGMAAALLCILITIGFVYRIQRQEVAHINKKVERFVPTSIVSSKQSIISTQPDIVAMKELPRNYYSNTKQIKRKYGPGISIVKEVVARDTVNIVQHIPDVAPAPKGQVATVKTRMKVVTLDDVVDEERKVYRIRQQSNIAVGVLPFSNIQQSNAVNQSNEDNIPRNTIKFKFN